MDGSLHKVQSVTGRGPSRQGFRGPAEALLRLINLNSDPPGPPGGFFLPWRASSTSIFAPAKILAQAEFTSAEHFDQWGPHRTCPVGMDRHGKAFEDLLKRCFSAHKPSLSTF